MKKTIFIMLTGIFLAVSVTSCREKNDEPELSEKEQLIQDMENDGADIKVKEEGDVTKIKMETDEKRVKIKEDEDRNSKVKVTNKTDDN
jgi:hypothetical protein